MERIDKQERLFLGDFQLIGQRLDAHAVNDPVADLLGVLPLFVSHIGRCFLLPRRRYSAEHVPAGFTQDRTQPGVFTQVRQDPQFKLAVVGG